MAKRKMTNNDLQNTTQKQKICMKGKIVCTGTCTNVHVNAN